MLGIEWNGQFLLRPSPTSGYSSLFLFLGQSSVISHRSVSQPVFIFFLQQSVWFLAGDGMVMHACTLSALSHFFTRTCGSKSFRSIESEMIWIRTPPFSPEHTNYSGQLNRKGSGYTLTLVGFSNGYVQEKVFAFHSRSVNRSVSQSVDV